MQHLQEGLAITPIMHNHQLKTTYICGGLVLVFVGVVTLIVKLATKKKRNFHSSKATSDPSNTVSANKMPNTVSDIQKLSSNNQNSLQPKFVSVKERIQRLSPNYDFAFVEYDSKNCVVPTGNIFRFRVSNGNIGTIIIFSPVSNMTETYQANVKEADNGNRLIFQLDTNVECTVEAIPGFCSDFLITATQNGQTLPPTYLTVPDQAILSKLENRAKSLGVFVPDRNIVNDYKSTITKSGGITIMHTPGMNHMLTEDVVETACMISNLLEAYNSSNNTSYITAILDKTDYNNPGYACTIHFNDVVFTTSDGKRVKHDGPLDSKSIVQSFLEYVTN